MKMTAGVFNKGINKGIKEMSFINFVLVYLFTMFSISIAVGIGVRAGIRSFTDTLRVKKVAVLKKDEDENEDDEKDVTDSVMEDWKEMDENC